MGWGGGYEHDLVNSFNNEATNVLSTENEGTFNASKLMFNGHTVIDKENVEYSLIWHALLHKQNNLKILLHRCALPIGLFRWKNEIIFRFVWILITRIWYSSGFVLQYKKNANLYEHYTIFQNCKH